VLPLERQGRRLVRVVRVPQVARPLLVGRHRLAVVVAAAVVAAVEAARLRRLVQSPTRQSSP
jgi:hypothetical protein